MTEKTIARKERRAIKRFLLSQSAVVAVLSISAALIFGRITASSVLLGGLIALIPNVFLAVYLFAFIKHADARKTMIACYAGEALKLVLIIILMILALYFFSIHLPAFLVGLMGTYLVYIFIGRMN